MKQIVVGSTAAKIQFPNWHRNCVDMDIWSDEPLEKYKQLDNVVMPLEILDAFEARPSGAIDALIATKNDLYTIKVSHLPWPIFFWKHANDALYMQHCGARLNKPLYELLKKYWKKEHGNKEQLSLYKSKEQFFDDAVPKLYDHDYLHELVSYPNRPIYTTVLKEGHSVYTDAEKWNDLPFVVKVHMLREEMNVIMCERWLLHDHIRSRITLPQAWRMSVEKTTTALTKGIYSEFIAENLEYFVLADKEETRHLFKTLKGV